MKEYDYREYYELGERLLLNGETVEVVVEDVGKRSCTGCRIGELSNVPCSSYCSQFEREDDESVMFKLVEEAKKEVPLDTPEYEQYDPNKDYAVYERFRYNGVVAECRECSSPLLCRDCVLYPCIGPVAMNCIGLNRKDGLNVHFKRLDDVRP